MGRFRRVGLVVRVFLFSLEYVQSTYPHFLQHGWIKYESSCFSIGFVFFSFLFGALVCLSYLGRLLQVRPGFVFLVVVEGRTAAARLNRSGGLGVHVGYYLGVAS
ncbi:uncharacterized protein GGS25DRAFT_470353, partial [Hypoxylon fragiforme]|uniref:uncharacterized protein n=1 Tax=Hypoxylon fragiforme TaxID=63214 RepID=UPI0020C5DF96